MDGVGERADRAGFGYGVGGAVEAAVAPYIEERSERGQGVERRIDAGAVGAAVLGVGGVAQSASAGEGAAVKVDGSGVQDGVGAERGGGEGEVVVALGDHSGVVERSARELVAKATLTLAQTVPVALQVSW